MASPVSTPAATEAIGNADSIILEHLAMVEPIAAAIRSKLPLHVELDDLIDAGIMGLLDAANRYDPAKGIAFASYASHRIRGAILDGLRELDPLSRDMRRRDRQIETARRELTFSLERTPTDFEVAGHIGLSLEKLREIEQTLWSARLAPGQSFGNNEIDEAPRDFPDSQEMLPDRLCERKHLRDIVNRTIGTLPRRHQQVIVLYYVRGLTMKEISQTIGVNESRVSQIRRAALRKMDVTLQAAGINASWIDF